MLAKALWPALLISGRQIDRLLHDWGYGVVFLVVLLQASGVPVPGTTALAAAAIYAATTHHLTVIGVIVAGSAAAIVGFAISYGVGRAGGWRLLARYGPRFALTPDRLAWGRAFFDVHGGKVVFFGRFVTGLRTWSGFIAGANLMPWTRFAVMSVAGGLVWAVGNGLGYYYFGDAISNASTAVQVALVVVGLGAFLATTLLLRRRARRFANAAKPEPTAAGD